MQNLAEKSIANQEDWRKIVKKYKRSDLAKSSWQLGSTLSLYILGWVVAAYAWEISPWLTLLVAALSQVYFGRLFIFMHDCGHGTFFKTKKARSFWGHVTGTLWMTPFWSWTKDHATHHRHSGNLDHRGVGDIWTLTTEEYEQASALKKFAYRVCRAPFFVLGFGGLYVYFISQRFNRKTDGKRERKSLWITNGLIVAQAVLIASLTSLEFYLFYQFFLVYFGSILSVFFFYVQHQYEDSYWSKGDGWDYQTAALEGSSYLKLPRIIQWASGNIGFHHIHHLCHSIPNYNLEKAFHENEIFKNPTTIKLKDCVKCFNLALIDLKNEQMISFKEYKKSLKIVPTAKYENKEEFMQI
ncbi:MAG: fatty acid desaturase [Halobacteriovoraceae bacterium]|nr:fatty acid desaturase [Halobacteriovoraceae bacterium]|tara:strand:+ start:8225 stop:9289 length:1065 start_codon:yes stop_codon:yes gene_type:complete